jgi:WD40 repeat protein
MACEGVVATPKNGTSNAASGSSTSCALVKRAVYGVGTNLRNPVAYADDESLAHVAGRTVVVYDATKKRQSFLHVPNQVKKIRAMAVHAGSKSIAIAVSNGEDASAVLVYDAESLKKKKTLRRAERKQTPVTTASVTTGSLNLMKPSTDDEMDIDGLAFSADGSSILGYSSSAETLARWNVADGSVAELASQRPNIVAGGSSRRDGNTTESRIVEAQFSSRDEDVVSAICTSGVFKLYRAQGKILKPFVVKSAERVAKGCGSTSRSARLVRR